MERFFGQYCVFGLWSSPSWRNDPRMSTRIVTSEDAVTLVGGGAPDPEGLAAALALAPRLVAADGGADAALAAGAWPERVIGDLDSISPTAAELLGPERLLRVTEQDTTDFEKALSRITAPLVVAVGFAGGRVDHALAALATLLKYPGQPTLLLGPRDVTCLAPPRLALDLAPGALVSLFPMGPVTGRSDGLRWPIDGIGFHPSGRLGTSNAALGPVTLEFDSPEMLLILPRAELGRLSRALPAAARWPAPAA